METSATNRLVALFSQWAGEPMLSMTKLPASGSYRIYYRLTSKTHNVLGAINNDVKENLAFIEFTRFFYDKGLRVPQVYAVDADLDCYILEDFGNTTLFDWLSSSRRDDEISHQIVDFYKQTIESLVDFQLIGRNVNFEVCYPRDKFDKQSMMWDLHYFKYYFLKLARISFDEQLLEDDFNRFADYLLSADCNYFLYRDFQSRNVMVVDNRPAFIDYQGGRKGALQYDLASLLFDAKANLPNSMREELLNHYIISLTNKHEVNERKFREHYYGYVLIRIMQAMGAYGFRGFYEKKEHFLKSIPYALTNLEYILNNGQFHNSFPSLTAALWEVVNSQMLREISAEPALTISINSFSYKRGIPIDFSGNGGGFVFDCRAIHNPGKYAEYKTKTGKDSEIIAFFEKETEMHTFLDNVYAMVNQSVEKYIHRGFKHLMVNFGCTGGQHRSVYCAEQLTAHLKSKYPVNVKIKHVEQDMK